MSNKTDNAAGHTAGPWELSESGLMVVGGHAKHSNPNINHRRTYIADCAVSSAYRESGEAKANARLIAAAPDLLAACEAVETAMSHRFVEGMVEELKKARVQLRAAVAKARSA